METAIISKSKCTFKIQKLSFFRQMLVLQNAVIRVARNSLKIKSGVKLARITASQNSYTAPKYYVAHNLPISLIPKNITHFIMKRIHSFFAVAPGGHAKFKSFNKLRP